MWGTSFKEKLMGFKSTDIVPLQPGGPTPTIPVNKQTENKVFQIVRTDTVSTLKCQLPANSTITNVLVYSDTGSNAGTTAVLNVGVVGVSATSLINGQSVLGAAGVGRIVPVVGAAAGGAMQLEQIPQGPDIQITGQYVETGAASSAGGPWRVLVEYVR
jgi:hypothetical protein